EDVHEGAPLRRRLDLHEARRAREVPPRIHDGAEEAAVHEGIYRRVRWHRLPHDARGRTRRIFAGTALPRSGSRRARGASGWISHFRPEDEPSFRRIRVHRTQLGSMRRTRSTQDTVSRSGGRHTNSAGRSEYGDPEALRAVVAETESRLV